jgi:hypothetical protein
MPSLEKSHFLSLQELIGVKLVGMQRRRGQSIGAGRSWMWAKQEEVEQSRRCSASTLQSKIMKTQASNADK